MFGIKKQEPKVDQQREEYNRISQSLIDEKTAELKARTQAFLRR